jgi:hypothetical protein
MAQLYDTPTPRLADPQAYDCTPSSLLASTPCLKCLSEHELLAVLVGILAMDAETDIPTLMEDSACFTCMTKKEMLQALVTIFGNDILGEAHSAQDVVDEYHCLVCATDLQLRSALIKLLCDFDLSRAT